MKTKSILQLSIAVFCMFFLFSNNTTAQTKKEIKVGIIGLDTSHSPAFAKALNTNKLPEFENIKVVAAYPHGSKTIEKSYSRIPKFTEDVEKVGVKIVNSIDELLKQVDVVMLETNDGRLHLEQAILVINAGKPLFIDKPITNSYKEAAKIFQLAQKKNVPVFSSSSLRYVKDVQSAAKNELVGKVTGVDTYSPATLEPTHTDLYWYGIHGVEMLFTVLGTGCEKVSRFYTDGTDIVVGEWNDGRVGVFRGTRTGKSVYGGTVFGEKGVSTLGKYEGYDALLVEIVKFFETGIAPVKPEETLEICAFIEAAQKSKEQNGKVISLKEISGQ